MRYLRNSRNWKKEYSYSTLKQITYLSRELYKFFPYLILLPLLVGNFLFYYLHLLFKVPVLLAGAFFHLTIAGLFISYLWYLYEKTPYLKRLKNKKIEILKTGVFLENNLLKWDSIVGIDYLPYKERKIYLHFPEDILLLKLKNGDRYVIDSSLQNFPEFLLNLQQHINNSKINGNTTYID